MRYPPGFWREIRPLDIFGIPAPMFSLYLLSHRINMHDLHYYFLFDFLKF